MTETDYLDLVRAMAYGPSQGEYTHDTLYGPLGRLRPGDVAISPNLQKKYPLGSQIMVRPQSGDPFMARVADSSYYGPGRPTKNTVEFWNGQDLGHVHIGPADTSALQRYKGMLLADDRNDLLKDAEDAFYGGGQAPRPTPTPTPPVTPRYSPDGMSAMQFASQSFGQPGAMATANSLAAPGATQNVMSGIAGALGGIAKGMQQGQQGSQQALAMLHTAPNPLKALLAQLTANPTAYLQPYQPYQPIA